MNPLRLWDRLSVGLLVLAGFRRVWLATPAGRVHTLVGEGAGGPDLVVLHGISAHGGHFFTVLPWLRRHFRRIVVPDLPAHGASDIPEQVDAHTLAAGLFGALDALIDRPALFYGNSMGGIAAVRYALRRPDRVAGLLLNSPGGAPESADELASFLGQFDLRSPADGRRFFDRLHRRPTWVGWLVGRLVRDKLAAPSLRRLLAAASTDDLLRPDEVRSLAMPVRLLWGSADALMPRHHLKRWRAMLPAHAEVATPDIGHCPYLDTPGALVAELRAFGARHAGST